MSETGELTLHPVAWYQGDLKEKFWPAPAKRAGTPACRQDYYG